MCTAKQLPELPDHEQENASVPGADMTACENEPITPTTLQEFLTRQREQILAEADGPSLVPPSTGHVSIATFAAWADGLIDDNDLQSYMHQGCNRCAENYDFYG